MRTTSFTTGAALALLSLPVLAAGCGQSVDAEPGMVSDVRSEYLIGADVLRARLGRDAPVLLDARSAEAYAEAHIPGALSVAWQQFCDMEGDPGDDGWGTVLDGELLGQALGALGVTADRDVVVYAAAQTGWGEDGRIAWMLRMVGLDRVRMLDGGFPMWVAQAYETTQESTEPTPAPEPPTLGAPRMDLVADTQWIEDHSDEAKVIDARSEAEYAGAADYGEARGGHLPGAMSLPFSEAFEVDGTVKPVAVLTELFESTGLERDDDIVVYCTAGIRSGHLALMLRMAGFSKARNYDESFYRWAALSDLPLE